MKNSHRNVSTLIILLLCIVFSKGNSFSADKKGSKRDDSNIRFHWAFVAVKNPKTESRLVRITKKIVLDTGDRIKFYFKLKKSCFLYLIHHSSQNELKVLFPYDLKQSNKNSTNLNPRYIPKGNMWFKLDEHSGKESFFLLASKKRLYELEKRLNNYKTAVDTEKFEQADMVLSEIRKLRRRQLKLKYVERPIAIIGGIRSAKQKNNVDVRDPADLATDISADDFLSKVYTIDHK